MARMRNPWLDLPTAGKEQLESAAVCFLTGMAAMSRTIHCADTVAAGLRRRMAHGYAVGTRRPIPNDRSCRGGQVRYLDSYATGARSLV